MARGDGRRFLMLQGPHGPFFRQLAAKLNEAGAETLKVVFNGGDAAFWWPRQDMVRFREPLRNWPAYLRDTIARFGATDLVLYGDSRSLHARALKVARETGLTTHIFEEGYLRPYWITYERQGTNGDSPLLGIPAQDIPPLDPTADLPERGSDWGELRQHKFYGALYHAALLAGTALYPHYRGHRGIPVSREAVLNVTRMLSLPLDALRRRIATRRLRRGGDPFHLVLLQLEHDTNFRDHGPFATIAAFLDWVAQGFAAGAPAHHHLIFKAHPLEDGRAGLRQAMREAARAHGLSGRIHLLSGGKLAELLDEATSAVTVNSTAGQQVLRRGLPLKAVGRAVYSGRGFTSDQPLPEFFAAPEPPDLAAYRAYRRYLLQTSQVAGGYYAARGRASALRGVVDMILDPRDPYSRAAQPASPVQHLSLVR